jgi:hypothetical protein
MGHTYGTWLPGDGRSFRTRHHREHVQGDYRNRPPLGTYDELHDRSKRLLKRDPVFLDPAQRRRAADEMVLSLLRRDLPVHIFSVDRIHFHGLIQVPDHNPRRWVGVATKECSHYCKQSGHAPEGGLWATRCKCLPVTGLAHFEGAAKYIHDHVKKGAALFEACHAGPRKPLPDLHDFDPRCLLID